MNSRQFRDALGMFPTGVCLVTLVDSEGRARALTVNSFSSVSLEPPLVLWSLQKNSEIYSVYADHPLYSINLLSAAQEDLSTQYAMKGDHYMEPEHFLIGANGAPLLHGALARFQCRLSDSHDAGDHTILIGEVLEYENLAGPRDRPLVFFGGQYRALRALD